MDWLRDRAWDPICPAGLICLSLTTHLMPAVVNIRKQPSLEYKRETTTLQFKIDTHSKVLQIDGNGWNLKKSEKKYPKIVNPPHSLIFIGLRSDHCLFLSITIRQSLYFCQLWCCSMLNFLSYQGGFNCSSLPARLGGNGEFERKFEEVWENLRKFGKIWGNLRGNNSQ